MIVAKECDRMSFETVLMVGLCGDCSGRTSQIVWKSARSRPRLRWTLYPYRTRCMYTSTHPSVLYSASHIAQDTIWGNWVSGGFVSTLFLLWTILHVEITPLWSLWLALEGCTYCMYYLGGVRIVVLYSVCTECPLSIVTFGNSWYVAVQVWLLIISRGFHTKMTVFCFGFSVMYKLWSSFCEKVTCVAGMWHAVWNELHVFKFCIECMYRAMSINRYFDIVLS